MYRYLMSNIIEELSILESKDLSLILRWRNHENIRTYMFSQNNISEEEHENWFNQAILNKNMELLIYKQNGKPHGFIQLDKFDDISETYEWGFYIDPDSVKGTGYRMTLQVLKYLFIDKNVNRLVGKVLEYNKSSTSLHKRLGFKLEGTLREQIYINGSYHSILYYGILASEYNQNYNSK